MATNATATLRFLPDGNTDNTLFWVERDVIKLYFQGIKGKPEAEACPGSGAMHGDV